MVAAVLATSGAVVCRGQVQAQPPVQAQVQQPQVQSQGQQPPVQAQPEWPKSIITAGGTVIDLYSPRVVSWSDDVVRWHSVMSVRHVGSDDPVYGAAWISAMVNRDSAARQLLVRSVHVDRLRIPDDTDRADNDFISTAMEVYTPWVLGSIPEPVDGGGGLAANAGGGIAADAGAGRTKIYYATAPTVLVLIDGAPRLEMNAHWGLPAVVNTHRVIVRGPDSNFYLYVGNRWYMAPDATGPYSAVKGRPVRQLRKIAADLRVAARKMDIPVDGEESVRKIIVRTEPALLIRTFGRLALSRIPHTAFYYCTNSAATLIFAPNKRRCYALFGDQWYMTRDISDSNGWTAIDRSRLPEAIVGKDARLDEEVPTVAKVDREATTTIDYYGPPRFRPIPGTGLEYATNTCSIVLKDNLSYYALDNGVWFVAESPLGYWKVSVDRPVGVDLIPRRLRVYRAKFVYIYETAPAYVYEGYLPGYDAGGTDGCALAETSDPDWMDDAWGYDLEFVFGWDGTWNHGYYRFDRDNRYYGHIEYGRKGPHWHERTFGPGAKQDGEGVAMGGLHPHPHPPGGWEQHAIGFGHYTGIGYTRPGKDGGIARGAVVSGGGIRGGYSDGIRNGYSGGISRVGFTGGGSRSGFAGGYSGGVSRGSFGGGSGGAHFGGSGGGGGSVHVSSGGGGGGAHFGGGGGGAHH